VVENATQEAKGQTVLDVAREYLPALSDDEVGFVLWNLTAFPACGEEILRGQLAGVRDKMANGKNLDDLAGEAEAEIDATMATRFCDRCGSERHLDEGGSPDLCPVCPLIQNSEVSMEVK
jgi:NADH pyrophosphatase NudC (nudix superfamily)